jgi:hypothetical protein
VIKKHSSDFEDTPDRLDSGVADHKEGADDAADSQSQAARELSPRKITANRGWTRTGVNFLLDAVLLTMFSAILAIAAILRFVFPPTNSAAGWRLWGWQLEQWHELLFGAIGLFALAVLLHVMLHWNWVCGVIASKLSKWLDRSVRIEEASKTLWGVSLLIGIFSVLAILLVLAALTIQRQ